MATKYIPEDRVRLVGEYIMEDFVGLTATVLNTLDGWIYDKFGDENSFYAQTVRYAYQKAKVEYVVMIDGHTKEIGLNGEDMELLINDPEIEALNKLWDMSNG